ncbi:MAG TPA: ADP-forming succinate--CoA ligase subunit beta [Dehalococcoidales bacterium]|nr:ADP-forming succinate--CoA ligase subunit beta [Dehalococcoidales bacterium]
MKLLEFEAKTILKEYGIPVPRGRDAGTPDEVELAAREIGGPVVLKAQIPVSGRGKAGGILFADDPAGARKMASGLLGSTIKESLVNTLLVEEALKVDKEYYLSVTIDRVAKSYVVLASIEGGVDIEQVALASPEKVSRYWTDPLSGLDKKQAREILARFDLSDDTAVELASMLTILFSAVMDKDAELVELNPLVRTTAGTFVAVDARMIIDDNALFRHEEFADRSLSREDETPLELEARKQNLAYVDLPGSTGVIGNGAGLVMATVDLVHHFGGSPANFLDIGGGGSVDINRRGLLLVLSKPEVKGVVVNIFGGITRCDFVAQAVIEAIEESGTGKPIAVSMMGTNEAEGKRMLDEAGVMNFPNMEEAVQGLLRVQGGH